MFLTYAPSLVAHAGELMINSISTFLITAGMAAVTMSCVTPVADKAGATQSNLRSPHATRVALTANDPVFEATLASLGLSPDNLQYSRARALRSEIGFSASAPVAAHEKQFADRVTPVHSAIADDFILPVQNGSNGGWRQQENGALVHGLSGMMCPGFIAFDATKEGDGALSKETITWSLINVRLYNEMGTDTACDYQKDEGAAFLTVYASRWPDVSLDQHFSQSVKLIVDGFNIQSESDLFILEYDDENAGQSTIEGKTKAAAFLVDDLINVGSGKTLKTGLWLNKTGDWHIKARVTFEHKTDNVEGPAPTEISAAAVHLVTLKMVDTHINTSVANTVSF